MKYACAQQRPKFKDTFVLAKFEADHPMDPFVIENIDTIIVDNEFADGDTITLEDEIDSMIDSPETLEVSVRELIRNENLSTSEPEIYRIAVNLVDMTETSHKENKKTPETIVIESEKEKKCICQRVGCQNLWSGPCEKDCNGKLCYCDDCMYSHECIAPIYDEEEVEL
jgi:GTPase Era involved in 16S rRNA processing